MCYALDFFQRGSRPPYNEYKSSDSKFAFLLYFHELLKNCLQEVQSLLTTSHIKNNPTQNQMPTVSAQEHPLSENQNIGVPTDTARRKAMGAYCRDLFAALQDALVQHTLGTGP